ncbi:MAG: glycerol acyltransferase, partial [Muribaculum sp.]|nr:glycerol acyltransferase [Muribaculum sp.]
RLIPKVNLEMALLPREIFNCRGREFGIRIGQSIAWPTLKSGQQAAAQAESIRNSVYNLE